MLKEKNVWEITWRERAKPNKIIVETNVFWLCTVMTLSYVQLLKVSVRQQANLRQ